MPWSLYEAMNQRCRDEYTRRMVEQNFQPKKQCDRLEPHRCMHPWHAEWNRAWYRERQRRRNLAKGHTPTPSLWIENRSAA